MADEIEVTGSPIASSSPKKKRAGLLSPEAAITALGAGWLFGPIGGLAGGLLSGILSRRLRQSELDAAAEDEAGLAELNQGIADQLANARTGADTDSDREQLDALAQRHAQWRELTKHSDPNVRARAFDELAKVGAGVSAWHEDIESRREVTEDKTLDLQRGMIVDLAKRERLSFETALENRRSLQTAAGQMHTLLNDAKFDVNNPLNRGRLIELMKSNSRTILADPEGLDDALKAAGGSAIVGPIAALIGGALGAEEFNFSKEDWRRVATALYDYESRQFASSMERIQQNVTAVETAANRLGVLPPDYSIADYVLGRTEEFPRPYAPSYPEGSSDAPAAPRTSNLPNWAERLKQRADELTRRNGRRPTN